VARPALSTAASSSDFVLQRQMFALELHRAGAGPTSVSPYRKPCLPRLISDLCNFSLPPALLTLYCSQIFVSLPAFSSPQAVSHGQLSAHFGVLSIASDLPSRGSRLTGMQPSMFCGYQEMCHLAAAGSFHCHHRRSPLPRCKRAAGAAKIST
jgi:hypothetical protein